MKVIKKGRKQKGWAKECECTGKGNGGGGCGAVLLVEEADLFQTERSCMGRDIDYFTTFECLDCGVKTDINHNTSHRLLPYNEWKKLQEEKKTN